MIIHAMKTTTTLLLATLILAGCGGGGSSSYDDAAAVAKAAGCTNAKTTDPEAYVADAVQCTYNGHHTYVSWFKSGDLKNQWLNAASYSGTMIAAGSDWAIECQNKADCEAMATAARTANGPIDIVIANAGAAASMPATKLDLARWHDMIYVNLTGAFLTVKAALADVTRQSGGPRRIIFIASTAGLRGYPYVAAYCAAKHGVVGLALALSL